MPCACTSAQPSSATTAVPRSAWPGPATIADATRWRLEGVTPLDDDVRLDYEPVRGAPPVERPVERHGGGTA